MRFKNFDDFVFENEKEKGSKHSYGCVMLGFTYPDMNEIHEMIKPDDVYTEEDDEGNKKKGLEKEPHVTLLYGLHSDEINDSDIKNVCFEYEFDTMKLKDVSIFENDDFDVLKFDVEGNSLNECNSRLSEFPFTTDFPEYHPHATIAYLTKGSGSKYVTAVKERMKSKLKEGLDVVPTTIIYSKPSGDKHRWDIAVNI